MSFLVDLHLTLQSFQLQVSLDLEQDLAGHSHSAVALIGANGSGKSSLLRCIAGAHRAQQGRIVVDDLVLFDATAGVDLPSEARGIAYLPQSSCLFPHLNVLDNVAFGARSLREAGSREQGRRLALQLLEELGCGHLARRKVADLSGGEQKRVALARGLLIEPRLLLLDEPCASLDVHSRRVVRDLVAAYLERHRCLSLIVTHEAKDIEAWNAYVYVLDGGQIVRKGSAQELRCDPQSEFVEDFFA